MKDLSSKLLLLTTTILGFAVSAPAMAQGASEDDPGTIVVTARRVEERLQDVPISISVYTPQQLANRNIVGSSDLGTYTPSLTINNRFGPEKSSFTIRGFSQDAGTSPSVGVYFADVVGPRAAGGTTSGNGAGVGSFFDLQNIQILKGPQGTLFGRNTTGGAVLLVPQKPTSRFEGYVEGTVGNYDQRRLQAVVNVPIGDSFRVRVGVDRNTRDGFFRNKTNIGPRDFGDVDYWAARVSAVADLTPNLENYTIVTYSNSDTNGYNSRIATCARNGADPRLSAGAALTRREGCAQLDRQTARGDSLYDIENSHPNPYLKLRTWQAINTTTWQASDSLTIKNIVSYSEFREKAAFSLNGDNFVLASPPLPNATLPAGSPFAYIHLYPAPGRNNSAQSTFTEELQFQGRAFDDRLNWQVGAYLELSEPIGFSSGYTAIYLQCADVNTLQCTSAYGTSGSVSNSATKAHFNNKGFYAQGTYKFTDQLSLTGGLRYTIDKLRSENESLRIGFPTPNTPQLTCNDSLRFQGPVVGGSPTRLVVSQQNQCHTEFRTESEKPTWLIGLDYKPIEDVLLYAKYARGYRQGGINPTNIGLETWSPEKLESYEIGLKASFTGAVRGNFNVAGFYNDLSNQQLQSNLIARPGTGIAGGNAIINAGKSRIKGVEVDASITPFDGFKLEVGYTYLDTELLEITTPTLPPGSPFLEIRRRNDPGDPLTLSPKNRVTATASYTLPLDESVGEITFGATFTHTDSQLADKASPLGILPATDLLNLNVNWNNVAGKPVDLALFATNVTKEVFPLNVGSSFASAGFETMIMSQPRMYGVRLKYRFGS